MKQAKRTQTNLILGRETITNLTFEQLDQVVGGNGEPALQQVPIWRKQISSSPK
jgi:hypothetical protein